MNDKIEHEIRQALHAEAAEVEVPDDLAQRTVEGAREAARPGLRERFRARRDARSVRRRVSGYPRWAYAGAAAAVMLLAFGVGTTVLQPSGDDMALREPGVAEREEATEDSAGVDTAQRSSGGGFLSRLGVGESGGEDVSGSTVEGVTEAPEDEAISPGIVPPPGSPGSFPPQLIRRAELEIEVESGTFERAWARANDIAGRHGGFITSSQTEMVEDRLAAGHLTIRVPADEMEAALRDFRRLGTPVRTGSSGTDVSGQLVDLDARIRALQAQETQLLELLQQARDVSDVLQVRNRLDEVRLQIEQLQAQKQHLQGQVDFATINASIFEPDGAPDGGDGRFEDAWHAALETALKVFAGLIVVMGFLVPFALIGFLLWLAVHLVRRRSA